MGLAGCKEFLSAACTKCELCDDDRAILLANLLKFARGPFAALHCAHPSPAGPFPLNASPASAGVRCCRREPVVHTSPALKCLLACRSSGTMRGGAFR